MALGTIAASNANTMVCAEDVNQMLELANNYGFALLFSVVVLGILATFFIAYIKKTNKKSDTEIDILYKERSANIQQNAQMFNLVTNVQTEQVTQLQSMTRVLQEINATITTTNERMSKTDESIEKMSRSIYETTVQNESIISTITEILEYVKVNGKSDREIIEKVDRIQHILDKPTEEV